jgi:hypothetical protein
MMPLTVETATEFDFHVLCDASGSMGNESKRFPGKTRWQEMQESVIATARAIEPFDADGITVTFFGPGVTTQDNVTAKAVADVFASRGPRGSTPLTEALATVIAAREKTGKKQFAFVFTDGEPDNQATVISTLTNAANSIDNDEDITFCFIQIGDDTLARKFLDHLDDNLNAKFDIVDVLSLADADNFEPLDLINKAIND